MWDPPDPATTPSKLLDFCCCSKELSGAPAIPLDPAATGCVVGICPLAAAAAKDMSGRFGDSYRLDRDPLPTGACDGEFVAREEGLLGLLMNMP